MCARQAELDFKLALVVDTERDDVAVLLDVLTDNVPKRPHPALILQVPLGIVREHHEIHVGSVRCRATCVRAYKRHGLDVTLL